MSFHVAFYFAASAIILAHSKIVSVNGQCTTEGCGHDDLSMSIIAEIREQNAQALSPLNKQIQNILDLLTSQHDAILRSLQEVDRRLEEHDVYIKQGQSFPELLNASFQEMKSQHDTVNMSIQSVDRRLLEQSKIILDLHNESLQEIKGLQAFNRRSNEHDVCNKQVQSIHELLNESFEEMKSLQAVDRRSYEHDVCINQVRSIQEFLNESIQPTINQHDAVRISLQELDRLFQEHNIYIKQIPVIYELLNKSFQQTQSQFDAVDANFQTVDRNLENYQIDIKNQTQISWKLVNGIYDVVYQERDCSDIKARRGYTANGVYVVCAGHQPNRVCANAYCDMKTNNSTSLVFQRRKDGSVNFNRTWAEYRDGFGNPDGEFWLGNEMLYLLTSKRKYKLRVDLEDFNGTKAYAEYSNFSISSSADNYTLTFSGYSGNAGDSMNYHNGRQFSTIDARNDGCGDYCARTKGGAWWYDCCSHSSLNGKYHQRHDTVPENKGVIWFHFKKSFTYSLKSTEMKLVPVA